MWYSSKNLMDVCDIFLIKWIFPFESINWKGLIHHLSNIHSDLKVIFCIELLPLTLSVRMNYILIFTNVIFWGFESMTSMIRTVFYIVFKRRPFVLSIFHRLIRFEFKMELLNSFSKQIISISIRLLSIGWSYGFNDGYKRWQ